jgi:hypothetical protein
MDRVLRSRLAFLEPLRTEQQITPGGLQAPLGRVTIVFMYIVGTDALLSWNAQVRCQAAGPVAAAGAAACVVEV